MRDSVRLIRWRTTANGAKRIFPNGWGITDEEQEQVRRGKDFIQLKNGPFDLDLIFAPDGIERFADAWSRRVVIAGFQVCSIDDIIASKRAANRSKDRESLERLEGFREFIRWQK